MGSGKWIVVVLWLRNSTLWWRAVDFQFIRCLKGVYCAIPCMFILLFSLFVFNFNYKASGKPVNMHALPLRSVKHAVKIESGLSLGWRLKSCKQRASCISSISQIAFYYSPERAMIVSGETVTGCKNWWNYFAISPPCWMQPGDIHKNIYSVL